MLVADKRTEAYITISRCCQGLLDAIHKIKKGLAPGKYEDGVTVAILKLEQSISDLHKIS